MRLRVLGTAVALCGVLVSAGFAQECAPIDPSLLKPDLVAQAPTKVRIVQRFGHRLLIFTTTITNVGDGPLVIHGQAVDGTNGTIAQATQEVRRADGTACTHTAGTLELNAFEHNFHLDDFAAYQLRSSDPFTGPIVAQSSPVALCVMDNVQVRGFNVPRQVFADCTDPNGTQGISVDYGDEYDNFLPEQVIDLDADPANPVPGGNYFLVNIADPDGLLIEKNDDLQANAGVASVSVPGLAGQPVPRQPGHPQPHSPATPTPKAASSPPSHAPRPTSTPQPTLTPTPTDSPVSRPGRPPRPGHNSSHPAHPPHSLPPGHEGCAGIGGVTCSASEFCEFLPGVCTIQGLTGVCTPMNQTCPTFAQPVCGCNGVTYLNDCQRRRAGVSAAHSGPC
ncbi:MAG TPA: Kazal-type serine protease inhibitor domain-containing protein [Candidatus Acidoferrales bacterium]|nr:Kazal-type serine protease inhibitor domain-containing protein [Candidatus Acidoferrales bacterium]